MIVPIKFATYLEVQAQEIKGTRSAAKTRLRLLSALARLLEEARFGDIKVVDITKAADLAKGTFFIYFQTKEEIVQELIGQYLQFERPTIPHDLPPGDSFQGVLIIVEWYEKTFAVNHGVLGCLIRLAGVDVNYAKLWRARNSLLLDRWMPLALGTLQLNRKHRDVLRHMMHSVGAIMDQSLFQRYGLGATVDEDELDSESLIEMHAVLIHRAIYGEDPSAKQLRYMKPLVELTEKA